MVDSNEIKPKIFNANGQVKKFMCLDRTQLGKDLVNVENF